MLHVRCSVCVALLAMATTTAVPGPAWAKKGKRGAARKAVQADGAGKGDAAKSKARKRARRMEKVGKVHYRKGRFDDALIAFTAAHGTDPQPKLLYNIARCHEKRGALAKAADFYERYLREAPDADDRDAVETQAEFLTQKLKATMGRLEVVSDPPGAGLRIHGEGEKIDVTTPWSGWLSPGRYEVSALLGDDQEFKKRVALAAGQERRVEARREGEDAETPKDAAPVGEPAPSPDPGMPATCDRCSRTTWTETAGRIWSSLANSMRGTGAPNHTPTWGGRRASRPRNASSCRR